MGAGLKRYGCFGCTTPPLWHTRTPRVLGRGGAGGYSICRGARAMESPRCTMWPTTHASRGTLVGGVANFLFGGSFVFCGDFLVISPPPPPPRKTGGGGSAINPPSDFFHEPSRLVFRTPITPIVVLAQYTIQLFLAPSKPPDTHYTHCVVFTAALKKMLQCF